MIKTDKAKLPPGGIGYIPLNCGEEKSGGSDVKSTITYYKFTIDKTQDVSITVDITKDPGYGTFKVCVDWEGHSPENPEWCAGDRCLAAKWYKGVIECKKDALPPGTYYLSVDTEGNPLVFNISLDCVPKCTEGAHEVLEYCPDGVTEKRWRDCIAGKWVEDSQECPVKKDTKLKCYDKTMEVGKKVTLEAKLEEATTPYPNIKDGLIKFYVSDDYVGGAWSDADGKAYVDYTPTSAGAYTIKAVFEAAGNYNGSEGEGTLTVKKPVVTQKVTVIGSGGFLGMLTFSGLGANFPVTRRERKKSVKFGRDLDKLTIATLFVNAGRAELSINGEKVMEAQAKFNQIETKAVLLKGGEGIPTKGENLEIELACTHVIGSGLKYAACATVVGIKVR